MREKLFEELNKYKHVVSPGSFLNNVVEKRGDTSRCSWAEKHEYLRKSKFTIAGDSIHYPGFVTEKIVDPFKNHSIPIYFGSTMIEKDFNTDAFILCREPEDIDETIERVKYLDTHDDAYIEMLMQQPLVYEDYTEELHKNVESFLVDIFSQPIEKAGRRIKGFCAERYESDLKKVYVKFGKPLMINKIK